MDGGLDADLVVALARAAVGDGVGADLQGHVDELLGDERATQRRGQGVGVLVEGVGQDGGGDVLRRELVLGIHDDDVLGAVVDGAGACGLQVRQGLPKIQHDAGDLGPVVVLEPVDRDRRVEAAGVSKDDVGRHRTCS